MLSFAILASYKALAIYTSSLYEVQPFSRKTEKSAGGKAHNRPATPEQAEIDPWRARVPIPSDQSA